MKLRSVLEKINAQLKLDKILQFLLCMFLFLLPWQTIYIYRESFLNNVKWEYGTLGFYGIEILLWVIVILFMVWFWYQSRLKAISYKLKATKDRVFILSLLFLISYFFISIIWASDKSLALQQSLRMMEAILLFLIIYIGPFEKQKLVKWFIYGAILPNILGIWQFLTQTTFASTLLGLSEHPVWQAGTSIIQNDTIGRWLRAYGPFSHPNIFGGYLVMVIAMFLSLRGAKRQSNPNEVGDCHAYPPTGGSARNDVLIYSLLITTLFLTFSRSAWMAAVIVLLAHCFITKKYHFIILPSIIITILSLVYFPLVQTRFSNQSVSEINSVEERVSGYSEAWQIFKQHSILGVGAGNYTLATYQLDSTKPGYAYQPVHNVLALFVVEEGVTGLLLFLFIVLSLISYLLFFKNEIGDRRYEMHLILFWLVLALFDHYLYSSHVGLMLGSVFFALILRKSENNTNLV